MKEWNNSEIAGKANAGPVPAKQEQDGAALKGVAGNVAGLPEPGAPEQTSHGIVEGE